MNSQFFRLSEHIFLATVVLFKAAAAHCNG